MHTRGSRLTALIRARWLDAVSQNFPSRKMYDMITPTGQPSLFDQMNVHSFWASSISCFVVVIEAIHGDVFVVVDWFTHASHGTASAIGADDADRHRHRSTGLVVHGSACLTRVMAALDPATIDDIPTPALVVERSVFEANLAAMDAVRPGTELRPHVKAFKSTAMAARLAADGHTAFCCATPREVEGLVLAGLGTRRPARQRVARRRPPRRACRTRRPGREHHRRHRLRRHPRRGDRRRRAVGAHRRRRRAPPLRLRHRATPDGSPTGPVPPASRCAA